MFCPIEQIELKTTACPVPKCIYHGPGGSCLHDRLSGEPVDVRVLSEMKAEKVYRVRALVQEAKSRIQIGTIILRYSDYIRDSWPDQTVNGVAINADDRVTTEDVHEPEDSRAKTKIVLSRVFGLTEFQQTKFLSRSRITEWAARQKVTLDLDEIRSVLRSISVTELNEV